MEVEFLALQHDPSSAAVARRAIAADLAKREITKATADDVVLVASELIGNALVHTGISAHADLAVSWEVDVDAVTVAVRDNSPRLPQRRATGETEISGRGLTIVAAIADEWGVRRSGQGKQVWARVPVTRGLPWAPMG